MKTKKQTSIYNLSITKANNDLQLLQSLQFLPWKTFTAKGADEFFTRHITNLTKSMNSGGLTPLELREAKALRTRCETELKKYLPDK